MKVAFYNHKGGVGKTSLAAHVAFRAVELNRELIAIDADKQGNLMDWVSNGNWSGTEDYGIGDVLLTTNQRADGDMVIVDCPPAFEVVANFKDVDLWVIPVSGRFSVSGAMAVIAEIKKVDKNPRVCLVANKVDPRTEFGRAELEEIKKMNVELFKLPIPSHDAIGKAELATVAAWQVPYGSRAQATQHLKMFSDWVLQGCNGRGAHHGN
jgi:cellulose biosynthesis protein BcsQ